MHMLGIHLDVITFRVEKYAGSDRNHAEIHATICDNGHELLMNNYDSEGMNLCSVRCGGLFHESFYVRIAQKYKKQGRWELYLTTRGRT